MSVAVLTVYATPKNKGKGSTRSDEVYILVGKNGRLELILSVMLRIAVLLSFGACSFAQTLTVTAVLNGVSSGPLLCPGLLALVSGTGFGSNAANVTVTVGGKSGYVTFVHPTLLGVQIPFEAPPGTTTLTVSAGGLSSAPFNVTLGTYAPTIYSVCNQANICGPAYFTSGNATGQPVTTSAPASPGEILGIFAVGLGPTTPATPTGPETAINRTATVPTVTVGGVPGMDVNAAIFAYPANGFFPGLYQVSFTVPPGVQGTQPLVISVAGTSSSPGLLPMFGLTALVSNASFGSAGRAAPGSIVTVFANGLGLTDQTTGFPETNFHGVQVTFAGMPAPLFHVIASSAQQQIDLLVPEELAITGTANVQLTTLAGVYPNYILDMAPAVPGLYRISDPSVKTRFNVIAQFANTAWLAMPSSMAAALKLPACSSLISPLSECGRPAAIGDYLVLYVTGLGVTTPNGDPAGTPLATGAVPPPDGSVLYETPNKPTVAVGGIPVTVLYSGLAPGFAGLYQIDFQIPPGVVSGDDVPVIVSMAGVSDTATVSVQPPS